MKFKVGQKVRMVEDECDARVGDIGTIVAVPGDNHSYAVEFPCFNGIHRGHNCDRLVPSGNGHWIDEYEMELVQETGCINGLHYFSYFLARFLCKFRRTKL